MACVRSAGTVGRAGVGGQSHQGKTDRLRQSEDRYSRHPDPGASAGSEPGAGRLGAATTYSPDAPAAFTAQTNGGNTYPDPQPHAQYSASPSPAACPRKTIQ